jgi:N-acetyltransferase
MREWGPVTITGQSVELRPLEDAHYEPLAAISNDDSIWRWYNTSGQSREQLRAWMDGIFDEQRRGVAVAFATVDRATGQVAGCTRFMNIDVANRRVEIGGTWLGVAFQRTHINTEAKYLMLRHAFETWGCHRVEFKTDALNTPSRNAILRVGAKEEGTLRHHMVTYTGRLRDSVYFSVVAGEWPAVKAGLELRMARDRT